MRALLRTLSLFTLLIFLAACDGNQSIVNNIQEKDANEIVVFLASKGIEAQKVAAAANAGAIGTPTNLFDINVSQENATDAMALLNSAGLPRRQGTTLLELFAKSGLMTTDKEEEIRYQAGLAEQISNTIRKIDGVLDADVQISFPPTEQTPGMPQQKATASVYIKHQGVLEDPNSHIETKIKRLVSSSISGLSYDDVAVISDRARIADITLEHSAESFGQAGSQQTYVSIWSIVMTKSSLARFRFLFFTLITLVLLLTGALGWLIYKFYPQLLQKKQPPPETL